MLLVFNEDFEHELVILLLTCLKYDKYLYLRMSMLKKLIVPFLHILIHICLRNYKVHEIITNLLNI